MSWWTGDWFNRRLNSRNYHFKNCCEKRGVFAILDSQVNVVVWSTEYFVNISFYDLILTCTIKKQLKNILLTIGLLL